jgi:hypothetical protein
MVFDLGLVWERPLNFSSCLYMWSGESAGWKQKLIADSTDGNVIPEYVWRAKGGLSDLQSTDEFKFLRETFRTERVVVGFVEELGLYWARVLRTRGSLCDTMLALYPSTLGGFVLEGENVC